MNRKNHLMESSRKIPIRDSTDVLVIGGGPSGISAAIAAARLNVKVTLIERFHQLGGMATGGYVLLFDDMADDSRKTIGGIVDEVIERLEKIDGVVSPPIEDRFCNSKNVRQRWNNWGFENVYSKTKPKSITFAASIDPECLSFVFSRLVVENDIQSLFGTVFSMPIIEGGVVKGAIFDGKSGRFGILAKTVIDATGDGDVFARSGAPYSRNKFKMTLVHRFSNVNVEKAEKWENDNPDDAKVINREIGRIYGRPQSGWWMKTPHKGVVWCNSPHFNNSDGINDADITKVILSGRQIIWQAYKYIRSNVPGFEDAILIDTASQIGIRQTRLLKGEYILKKEDILSGKWFADRIGRGRNYYYPYRCLIPQKIDNLIVTGRCFSATPQAQIISREIPAMMVLGQAAGVAAAFASKSGIKPRTLNVADIQKNLISQGVILGPNKNPF